MVVVPGTPKAWVIPCRASASIAASAASGCGWSVTAPVLPNCASGRNKWVRGSAGRNLNVDPCHRHHRPRRRLRRRDDPVREPRCGRARHDVHRRVDLRGREPRRHVLRLPGRPLRAARGRDVPVRRRGDERDRGAHRRLGGEPRRRPPLPGAVGHLPRLRAAHDGRRARPRRRRAVGAHGAAPGRALRPRPAARRYNLALAAIIYVVFGGWQLLRERRAADPARDEPEEEIRIEGDPGVWVLPRSRRSRRSSASPRPPSSSSSTSASSRSAPPSACSSCSRPRRRAPTAASSGASCCSSAAS